MLRRNLWLILGLLATAGLSWWLFTQVQMEGEVAAREKAHRPDFFLDDFTLTVMNEQGRAKHRVQAPHMVHFPDDDSAEVNDPYVEIYRPHTTDWHIRARFAWIGPGGERVRMQRDVRAERLGNADVQPLTMLTEELLALPDEHYMETDLPVTFLSPGWNVQAIGMQSWLNEGRMHLLSQVRGIHEPNQP